MASTIYERSGGFPTVRKIVSAFYDNILSSEQLAGYFADIDMRRQIDHQTKFIASVMGGPVSYGDEVLRRVHAPLEISRDEFDELIDLLQETLEDFEVAADDIDYIVGEMKRRMPIIIAPGA
jgi:hemoglobin